MSSYILTLVVGYVVGHFFHDNVKAAGKHLVDKIRNKY
jgi:hypothetical protein